MALHWLGGHLLEAMLNVYLCWGSTLKIFFRSSLFLKNEQGSACPAACQIVMGKAERCNAMLHA